MGVDYDMAVKVSCGFGGGMYIGSVCGAVTGGIMAIGLKHGGVGMRESVRTATAVREFTARFKAQHKSINCPDLTGFDTSTVDFAKPETFKTATDKNLFVKCSGYVRDAAQIATELVLQPAH